jgi:hypothetical protein
VISVMYLNFTPLLLASSLAFFMGLTSSITEGPLASKQAFISVVALETNRNIASVAVLLSRNISVRSTVVGVVVSPLLLLLLLLLLFNKIVLWPQEKYSYNKPIACIL